ncbi:MAG TPA: GNAT family N-acetyltransferase [Vicinamibacterales bacterium]|nr:GNAT family N-acetyltransferase [Vicinamibacterales bacterium]
MTTVEVISQSPDVTPFRDEWQSLYARCATEPSTSFEWSDALLHSHVAADEAFVLLRLTRDGAAAGLIPLTARRMPVMGYPVVVLGPLSEHYNTHSDLLVHDLDEETVAALAAALAQLDLRWDIFRMSTLLDDHALLRCAPKAFAGIGALQVRAAHASYFLSLPATYDDYLAERSAKFRNHLKRLEKKLEASGAIAVREITAPEDAGGAFDALMQIERQSWKHAHGTAISAVPRQADFYKRLCDGAAGTGRLHLQVLFLDGVPVAYNLGYLAHNAYAYLKTSFVERCKPLGVAAYLRARLVESMIVRGVEEIDFPAEPYEWERQWTNTARWHKALAMYRATAAGRVLSWVDTARHHGNAGGGADGHAREIAHVDPRGAGRTRRAMAGGPASS